MMVSVVGDEPQLSLTFSTDGNIVASGNASDKVILWSRLDLVSAGQFQSDAHGGITSIAFRPDGQMIVAGHKDGMLTLMWLSGASSQSYQINLSLHQAQVNTLVFSPDGTKLASSGADRRIILWDLDFETWKSLACRQANRNLTQAEWGQYFPGEAYRNTCPAYPEGP